MFEYTNNFTDVSGIANTVEEIVNTVVDEDFLENLFNVMYDEVKVAGFGFVELGTLLRRTGADLTEILANTRKEYVDELNNKWFGVGYEWAEVEGISIEIAD